MGSNPVGVTLAIGTLPSKIKSSAKSHTAPFDKNTTFFCKYNIFLQLFSFIDTDLRRLCKKALSL